MRRALRAFNLAGRLALLASFAPMAAANEATQAPPSLPSATSQLVPPTDTPLGCNVQVLPKPLIEIDVRPTTKPPIDRSLNAQQLTYVARQLGSQHSRAGRVLGLTKVRFSYRVGPIRFAAAMDGSTLCLHPSDIKVQLQAAQEVLIVKTSDAGSCWDAAILEHEMKHVGYNNQVVRQAAGILPPRLRTISGIVHGNDTQKLAEALAKRISDIVAQALTEGVDAARTRHAEYDDPRNQNSNRLRARCIR
ncbi:hypothetical protein SAMN07250955_102315 [Arboricoccus pini]|uniref:Uncharacterized protein n=1 Tax=Arboricoccus pini TaxID=1963835 RepID=A0A212QQA0_9PROT|nr:hypothetical protein [Arboricoccus pini]SNB61649.1 hypothetical protein SAMN07250955_102315 [Arboricoccus pini]